MSKKEKPLDILLIDDEVKYSITLQNALRAAQIKVHHVTNLEAGKKFMSLNSRKIVAVVLDVLCLETEDQEVIHESFIGAALKFFDQEYRYLPKLILTGESGQKQSLSNTHKGTIKVFSKASDEEKIAAFIKDECKNLDYIQISKDCPEICELFDKNILDNAAWVRFLSIYKNQHQNDMGMIESNLNNLRKLQEDVYKAINAIRPDLISTQNIEGGVKCNAINLEFVNNKTMERNKDILNQFVWSIYNIASNFGSHSENFMPLTKPTKYTVRSLYSAMCDLLLWCHSLYLEKHDEKYKYD